MVKHIASLFEYHVRALCMGQKDENRLVPVVSHLHAYCTSLRRQEVSFVRGGDWPHPEVSPFDSNNWSYSFVAR